MTREITIDLATLRFSGARFNEYALGAECLREVAVYRKLILESAKALWRRRHFASVPLPERLRDERVISVDRVATSSALIPMRYVCNAGHWTLSCGELGELDEAAELIDATLSAIGTGRPLPRNLPLPVFGLFAQFGTSLREGETLFIRARHSTAEVAFDLRVRSLLTQRIEFLREGVRRRFMSSARGGVRLRLISGALDGDRSNG